MFIGFITFWGHLLRLTMLIRRQEEQLIMNHFSANNNYMASNILAPLIPGMANKITELMFLHFHPINDKGNVIPFNDLPFSILKLLHVNLLLLEVMLQVIFLTAFL